MHAYTNRPPLHKHISALAHTHTHIHTHTHKNIYTKVNQKIGK